MPRTLEEGRIDGRFEGKMRLDLTPYERTLYVDTDTYFYGDCHGLFRLLDWYDFAMVPSTGSDEVRDPYFPHGKIQGYTPWNLGVVLYRMNDSTRTLLKRYREFYREKRTEQRSSNDQGYFSLAFAESYCKVHPLPTRYNARVDRFISLFGKVMIAHGKNVNFEEIEPKINCIYKNRIWNRDKQECIYAK
jgi:lipopolysaccharide biosynthesis glycosyltransferase